ncbi:MAG: RnfABCDGE type electron transport complex subunit D, partial [Deltaproteobacteria bacterium]|nr:RnfABCDGE type electron transport complex subunit D [Deltaproteobacteria bacterium]
MAEDKKDIQGGGASEAPFIVSSSPHLLKDESIPKIMHTVIAALLPAMAVSVYFFRLDALILIVTCLVASLATEYVIQRLL